jgi:hypothetical protein
VVGAATVLAAVPARATPTMRCGLNTVNVFETSSGVTTTTYVTPGRSLQVTGRGVDQGRYWFHGTKRSLRLVPAGW